MIKKRIQSYLSDTVVSILIMLMFGYCGYVAIEFILQFVQAVGGDGAANVVEAILMLLLRIVLIGIAVLTMIGTSLSFGQSTGKWKRGLKTEGPRNRLIAKWVIRYGIVPLFVIWEAPLMTMIYTWAVYLVYTLIDFILLLSIGETLTDRLLGTKVVEEPEKPKRKRKKRNTNKKETEITGSKEDEGKTPDHTAAELP
ncbi:hypothetical protein A8F94_14600 [Bacillus sp. FJAT-27225]|uniref:hypothetical protein n=1 Tax=Bacillus sp. FJAT-27225 TaxID=1743144 RepID=UPI00080C2E5B|nr:hypothetical protein [Bacillus sp. FJAT-27225]OCA86067.1 hypothetical protein A8F94_14600 [Bacillus sp. FJAT-27225]